MSLVFEFDASSFSGLINDANKSVNALSNALKALPKNLVKDFFSQEQIVALLGGSSVEDIVWEIRQSNYQVAETADDIVHEKIANLFDSLLGSTPVDTRRLIGSWTVDDHGSGDGDIGEAPLGNEEGKWGKPKHSLEEVMARQSEQMENINDFDILRHPHLHLYNLVFYGASYVGEAFKSNAMQAVAEIQSGIGANIRHNLDVVIEEEVEDF